MQLFNHKLFSFYKCASRRECYLTSFANKKMAIFFLFTNTNHKYSTWKCAVSLIIIFYNLFIHIPVKLMLLFIILFRILVFKARKFSEDNSRYWLDLEKTWENILQETKKKNISQLQRKMKTNSPIKKNSLKAFCFRIF